MLSTSTQNRLKYALGSGSAAQELVSALGVGLTGNVWYVDTEHGDASYDGKAWDTAFVTMAAALSAAQTLDTIVFRGDVREQLTGSNIKYDITIIGAGSKHHPDDLTTEDPGASMWRMPASGGSLTTPLLIVRGRGWNFINITFDGPDTAATVQLVRTAEGASEYDASHATFLGCRFLGAQNHIEDNGGVYNLTIKDCEFQQATAASILNVVGAGIGTCLNWKILGNRFASNVSSFGNATHIDAGMNCGIIKDNVFGTVVSNAAYIDLTGGAGNVVTGNTFGGVYTTADYVAGTNDLWLGNWVTVITTQAPNGFTVTVPAA